MNAADFVADAEAHPHVRIEKCERVSTDALIVECVVRVRLAKSFGIDRDRKHEETRAHLQRNALLLRSEIFEPRLARVAGNASVKPILLDVVVEVLSDRTCAQEIDFI